jgi:hypothetical protein
MMEVSLSGHVGAAMNLVRTFAYDPLAYFATRSAVPRTNRRRLVYVYRRTAMRALDHSHHSP